MQKLTLNRFPPSKKGDLRAWDAADELIIEAALNHLDGAPAATIWVIEDSFGAIRLNLEQRGYRCLSVNDSVNHQHGIHLNANHLSIDLTEDSFYSPLSWPSQAPDLVLMKLPKSLRYLSQINSAIKRSLANAQSRCLVISASMVKHTPKTYYQQLERELGATHTSLARKKARLAYSQAEGSQDDGLTEPELRNYTTQDGIHVVALPNAFSPTKLDPGSALLINHLDDLPAGPLIDLGCGTGVLSCYAARKHAGPIFGCDISHSAVSSAARTAASNGVDGQYTAMNILEQYDDNWASAIICNPPFHDKHAVGDEVAINMFHDAKRVLTQGGELRIVGNRHLGYHQRLKTIFGNCRQLASDSKFVILSAKKL